MTAELLNEFVLFLKDIAPEIWEIMLKQVYIQAIVQVVLGGLMILCVFKTKNFISRAKRKNDEEDGYDPDYDMKSILLYALLIVLIIISGLFFVFGIQGLLNPEYYAIQLLIQSIPR